ncbi:MAG: murein L,D-transpeptidase catalytic domain family protein [Chlorobiaceae bacterium]|nr:murein L,D-transpeptidase catalytic domain family protein [Chlorobiaceae bacterium]
MKRGVAAFLMLLMAMPLTGSAVTWYDASDQRSIATVMQSIEQTSDIDPRALQYALQGYFNLKRQGMIRREGIVTLIDFDKPSDSERLYVIDIENGRLLHSALVAHGKNSGEIFATSFSNEPGSNKSSLGFYLTEKTYIGRNGYSLVLKGLDQGLNDKAEQRSIVIHGAGYVSRDYIRSNGRLGRSEGCPALSYENCVEVIDLIRDGSCLFIYHNNNDYTSGSTVLNPDIAFETKLLDNPL